MFGIAKSQFTPYSPLVSPILGLQVDVGKAMDSIFKASNNICKAGVNGYEIKHRLGDLSASESQRVEECVGQWKWNRGAVLFCMSAYNVAFGVTRRDLQHVWRVIKHPKQTWNEASLDGILRKIDFRLVRGVALDALDVLTLISVPLLWTLNECKEPENLGMFASAIGNYVTCTVLTSTMARLREISKVMAFAIAVKLTWGLYKHGCSKKYIALHALDFLACTLEVTKVALTYMPQWQAYVPVLVADVLPYGLGFVAASTMVVLVFCHLKWGKPEKELKKHKNAGSPVGSSEPEMELKKHKEAADPNDPNHVSREKCEIGSRSLREDVRLRRKAHFYQSCNYRNIRP